MTRLTARALLILAGLSLASAKSNAQIFPRAYPRVYYPPAYGPPRDPSAHPFEAGAYLLLGGAIEETPADHTGTVVGAAGVYGQWNRFGLCPGLDLRIQGNDNDLHGFLIGPRVAYQPKRWFRPFRFYAEGLFGKNEIPYNATVANVSSAPMPSRAGVTRSVVVGLDLRPDDDSHFSWRVIEFSKGDFTGLAGSHPQTITTGIILHIP